MVGNSTLFANADTENSLVLFRPSTAKAAIASPLTVTAESVVLNVAFPLASVVTAWVPRYRLPSPCPLKLANGEAKKYKSKFEFGMLLKVPVMFVEVPEVTLVMTG